MTSLLVTGIAELVTNDPTHDGTALGVIDDAAVVVERRPGRVGRPSSRRASGGRRTRPRWPRVLPGFVDSHSHLVFAGDRAEEFAARMAGQAYAAGGIRTTVAATRAATDEQLAANVARLVAEMRRQGTTTVEIKSGYGLTRPSTRPAAWRSRGRLHRRDDVPRRPRRPPEYADDPAGYVDLVTGPMLEAAAPHAKWIDVFCERGAFDADQAAPILAAGRPIGLAARLHANQLGHGPGVPSACEVGAASADHCTYLDRRGRRRTGRLRHRGDAAARRGVLDPVAVPRRRRCSTPASRSRSPPTATPAPATPRRCRCASRSRSARCGCRRLRRSGRQPPAVPRALRRDDVGG